MFDLIVICLIEMGNKATLTFIGAILASFGMIGYVHYAQEAERLQLKAGVERDIERQRLKALEMESRKS